MCEKQNKITSKTGAPGSAHRGGAGVRYGRRDRTAPASGIREQRAGRGRSGQRSQQPRPGSKTKLTAHFRGDRRAFRLYHFRLPPPREPTDIRLRPVFDTTIDTQTTPAHADRTRDARHRLLRGHVSHTHSLYALPYLPYHGNYAYDTRLWLPSLARGTYTSPLSQYVSQDLATHTYFVDRPSHSSFGMDDAGLHTRPARHPPNLLCFRTRVPHIAVVCAPRRQEADRPTTSNAHTQVVSPKVPIRQFAPPRPSPRPSSSFLDSLRHSHCSLTLLTRTAQLILLTRRAAHAFG